MRNNDTRQPLPTYEKPDTDPFPAPRHGSFDGRGPRDAADGNRCHPLGHLTQPAATRRDAQHRNSRCLFGTYRRETADRRRRQLPRPHPRGERRETLSPGFIPLRRLPGLASHPRRPACTPGLRNLGHTARRRALHRRLRRLGLHGSGIASDTRRRPAPFHALALAPASPGQCRRSSGRPPHLRGRRHRTGGGGNRRHPQLLHARSPRPRTRMAGAAAVARAGPGVCGSGLAKRRIRQLFLPVQRPRLLGRFALDRSQRRVPLQPAARELGPPRRGISGHGRNGGAIRHQPHSADRRPQRDQFRRPDAAALPHDHGNPYGSSCLR